MKSRGIFGILKRALPFAATFAVGLFIASFFVDITAPRFRGHRGGQRHQMREMRLENERLRNENLRLKNELESHDGASHGYHVPEAEAPPPPAVRRSR